MQKYAVRTSFAVPKGMKAELQDQTRLQGISLSESIRRAASIDRLRTISVKTDQ